MKILTTTKASCLSPKSNSPASGHKHWPFSWGNYWQLRWSVKPLPCTFDSCRESMAIDLTEDSFYAVTAQPGKKVVQFTALWCGPCKMLTPRLESLAEQHGFDYYKVNVDDNSQLARDFRIMSIPTVQVYVDGRLQNTFTGVKSEEVLKDELGLTA